MKKEFKNKTIKQRLEEIWSNTPIVTFAVTSALIIVKILEVL